MFTKKKFEKSEIEKMLEAHAAKLNEDVADAEAALARAESDLADAEAAFVRSTFRDDDDGARIEKARSKKTQAEIVLNHATAKRRQDASADPKTLAKLTKLAPVAHPSALFEEIADDIEEVAALWTQLDRVLIPRILAKAAEQNRAAAEGARLCIELGIHGASPWPDVTDGMIMTRAQGAVARAVDAAGRREGRLVASQWLMPDFNAASQGT